MNETFIRRKWRPRDKKCRARLRRREGGREGGREGVVSENGGHCRSGKSYKWGNRNTDEKKTLYIVMGE